MGLSLPTCFRNDRSLRKRKAPGQRGTPARVSGRAVLLLANSITTNQSLPLTGYSSLFRLWKSCRLSAQKAPASFSGKDLAISSMAW